MKWMIVMLVMLVVVFSLIIFAGEEKIPPSEELKTPEAKLSYAIGMDIGTYLKNLPTKVDLPVMIQGVEDSFKGKELLLTPEQAQAIQDEFRKKMEAEQVQKQRESVEKNRKEGSMFLEENKKKKGVVTTASGLQYTVLTEGTGSKPKTTDVVCVNYRGTLIGGTEFDSSYKRGQPATFPLNRVIPGWTEALQLMPVGSKYRLFIPSNLAYGERGSGKLIGPNSTLIFEVELLEIQK